MRLKNIKGKTYYIRGGTNTGIIKLDNNKVLIIDPGLGGMRPRKINELLKENGLSIKYIINTHEHDDHYNGCNKFKEIDNTIQILSSKEAKLYIENPNKFNDFLLGGKRNKFLTPKMSKSKYNAVKIDNTIDEGKLVLNNKEFEIIKLKGHTEGSIGILTEDKVLFVGDLFIEDNLLNKFNLILMYDVKEYLNSINIIKNIEFDYMVLGHSRSIISKEESYKIIEKHKNIIYSYINQVKDLLRYPISIDCILKNIIINNDLDCNYKEYYFYRSTIMSIIGYLCELDKVNYSIKSGEMLYYFKTT